MRRRIPTRVALWWLSKAADTHLTLIACFLPLPVLLAAPLLLPPLLAWLVVCVVWGSALGWLMSEGSTLK